MHKKRKKKRKAVGRTHPNKRRQFGSILQIPALFWIGFRSVHHTLTHSRSHSGPNTGFLFSAFCAIISLGGALSHHTLIIELVCPKDDIGYRRSRDTRSLLLPPDFPGFCLLFFLFVFLYRYSFFFVLLLK